MARAEVIDDLAAAAALAPAWDELAQEASLPLCAPGWMLSWWRHMAPEGSELRIVAVRDGETLVARAPWCAGRGPRGRIDVRFLGAQISDRVDVLCRPGREREAADAIRRAIPSLRPRPDLIAFEAVAASSVWTRLLASGAAGRARLAPYRNSELPAPTVTLPLQGGFDGWMAGRSSNFRSQMRRMRRKLESAGGAVRMLREPGEVSDGLAALLALHRERWSGRGESGLARAGVPELLAGAAAALGPDRLRLWVAEIDGEPISVQLFIAAGSEIKYWNGGWAEAHAALKPSMLTILAAIEDAIGRGERRMDLGVGTHEYKLRFADGEDPITWGGLIARNRRWAATRAELAPVVLRYRAKRVVEVLPEPLTERVAAAVRARRDE
jgi:CelD/BcsL family acetyltransferase involved in cellulose biosynthesis